MYYISIFRAVEAYRTVALQPIRKPLNFNGGTNQSASFCASLCAFHQSTVEKCSDRIRFMGKSA